MANEPPAFELYELHKRFGDKKAVDDVSLSVPGGSFYGLVGPNGAGKTTSLTMAVGLLRPDSGGARVFGIDVWSDPVRAKSMIGVLPDGMAMPERLTGREMLSYLGRLRGLPEREVDERVDDLLDGLGLAEAENTLIIEYSAGMRKKIGLAGALVHAPRLLVLDEPFEAVDPISASVIKGILRSFTDGGGSVIISSHVMALVEQICDHVGVIARGRVLAEGALGEVRGEHAGLEEAFVELVGAPEPVRGFSWLA
ncbi:ABC transporter ATP-binding protein [Nocardiopsis alba]|uniref:ABC transporter family protein n=1 Tax=Nocardiopsis alba (strain ATCC BAA-2165 / BE74) TaxID=1205910 RepID=J7LA50_NOCAA|nr:ABC transporter ATP-binding protein [Nocardiopsis alba]AFR07367.1 ABC transporter family protein [Nocardiopsis alba ATCC BAA-2165]